MTNPWTDQRKRWKRFEAWEIERFRSEASDFAKALAWMSDAWELASQADPAWGSSENSEAHWRHLFEIQSRLGRLRPRS